MSLSDFHQEFQARLDVLETLCGPVGQHPNRVDAEFKGKTTKEEAKAKARDKFLAMCFLTAADPNRYGELVNHLDNEYLLIKKPYPQDLREAYNLLVRYKPRNQHGSLHSFYQDGEGGGKGRGRGAGRGRGGHGGRGRGGGGRNGQQNASGDRNSEQQRGSQWR